MFFVYKYECFCRVAAPFGCPFRVFPFGSLLGPFLGPFWVPCGSFFGSLLGSLRALLPERFTWHRDAMKPSPSTLALSVALGKIHYASLSCRGVPLRSLSVREEKKKKKKYYLWEAASNTSVKQRPKSALLSYFAQTPFVAGKDLFALFDTGEEIACAHMSVGEPGGKEKQL